ncbi:MAG: hypothetical protein RL088_1854 [Verrucomicrobiota bacterium]
MTRTTILLSTLLVSFQLHAENWPAWRGEGGQGICVEKNLPTTWSKTEGIRWRTVLPDKGNSTPIVWGGRVFVTQALEKERVRGVMCFDRKDGRLLWQSSVPVEENEPTHATNPQGSSSPVTDGERVIAWFGSAGLVCYNLDGRELWRRDLGKQKHEWGWASSPVIHGDLCLLNFGPGESQFIIALKKTTGEIVWKKDIAKPSKEGWNGSWSTPVIMPVKSGAQVLLSVSERLSGIEPATGREVWYSEGLNPLVYTSPIFSDGVIVANGGYNGAVLAVRAGGSGDVTGSHRLWHIPKGPQRIGSGVIHEGHIYIVDDPGIAQCIDLKTGVSVWKERLPRATTNWSSAVLADGNIYSVSQAGDVLVFKAATKFEMVAVNSLGERSNSSVAISNGDIFIRTHSALWCVGGR